MVRKEGVYSKQDFLNNHQAQKNAAKIFHKDAWKQLRVNGSLDYMDKTIKGIKITPSGLIAGAHLMGASNVLLFLKSNGTIDQKDNNKTPVSKYIQKYGDYDTYETTSIPTWERYKKEYDIKEPKYTPDKIMNNFNDKTYKKAEEEHKYYTNKYKEYKEHVKDVIKYGDKANKDHKAFLEGFDSGYVKGYAAMPNYKSNTKKSANSNSDDGYWYTTKNGKHVFVET